jgi:hypothetical protein
MAFAAQKPATNEEPLKRPQRNFEKKTTWEEKLNSNLQRKAKADRKNFIHQARVDEYAEEYDEYR